MVPTIFERMLNTGGRRPQPRPSARRALLGDEPGGGGDLCDGDLRAVMMSVLRKLLAGGGERMAL